jgi:hypothetical protein
VTVEPQIDWHSDRDQWIGGCAVLPNALMLIVPSAWGKVMLRVFNRGNQVHEREHSDADTAKAAAVTAVRLLALREAV